MQVRTVLALALHAGGNHPGASLSWLRRSHWPGQQGSPFGSLRTAGTTGEIAQDFFLVIDIVKKHTSHILSRLEATSRTHAVALARLLGLIP